MDELSKSKIDAFYKGQKVFCTGASGMFGTVYISSLVLSTPVSRVYALVRGGETRLWDIWRTYLPLDTYEAVLKSGKVVVMDGDITLPGCGLDHATLKRIQRNATVIVHAASSMHLNNPLSEISSSIVYASQALASIALGCRNLAKFVYVSSAYAGAFLRHDEDGRARGQDATIEEDVNQIRSNLASLDAELDDMSKFGRTPESQFVRHLHDYTYAKHLAERLILREFQQHSVPDKLLIFRPSAIGPAENFPCPFFEIPGSSPVTTIMAALLVAPPVKMPFSSYLADPATSTFDEIPVDIVSNRLIVHIAYGSSGCVHAVPGDRGRQMVEEQWKHAMKLRRFWLGRPRLVWRREEWGSDKLCALSRLFPAFGNAFVFAELKSEKLWSRMSVAEQMAWPLWATENLQELDYIKGRRSAVEALVGRTISKQYGLPASWSKCICGRFGG